MKNKYFAAGLLVLLNSCGGNGNETPTTPTVPIPSPTPTPTVISGGNCSIPGLDDPLWDDVPLPFGSFLPNPTNKFDIIRGQVELGPMSGVSADGKISALIGKLQSYGHCAIKYLDGILLKVSDSNGYEEYYPVNAQNIWTQDESSNPRALKRFTDINTCDGDVEPTDHVDCSLLQEHLIDCTPKDSFGHPIRSENNPQRRACELKSMKFLGGYPHFVMTSDTLGIVGTQNPMQVNLFGVGSGVLTCYFPISSSRNYCNQTSNGLLVTR